MADTRPHTALNVGGNTETSEAAPPPASEAHFDRPEPQGHGRHGDRGSPAAAPAKDELAVIATNGHATERHAANGNGKANGNGGGTSAITLNLGATKVSFQTQADAPSCADCGSIMVRNGSCYKCLNCGSTSGCS